MGDGMNFITRHAEGVIMNNNQNNIQQIGILAYINQLCLLSCSTLEGRIQAAKKILNKKRMVPIYLNHEILFFQTKAIRDYNTIFINYFNVGSTQQLSTKKTLITFLNGDVLTVFCSYQKIKKQLQCCEELLRYCTKL
jgi:competence transcription factor ComK